MSKSKNGFFSINLRKDMIHITCIFPYEKENAYYQLIVKDFDNRSYNTLEIENNKWFERPFYETKYDFTLLEFDGNETKIVDTIQFDIRNHNYLINLKSHDISELMLWKGYLDSVQSHYSNILLDNIKVVVNGVEPEYINDIDFVEISYERYIEYLKNSNKPLTDDYSSLTIIKTLFNVI